MPQPRVPEYTPILCDLASVERREAHPRPRKTRPAARRPPKGCQQAFGLCKKSRCEGSEENNNCTEGSGIHTSSRSPFRFRSRGATPTTVKGVSFTDILLPRIAGSDPK